MTRAWRKVSSLAVRQRDEILRCKLAVGQVSGDSRESQLLTSRISHCYSCNFSSSKRFSEVSVPGLMSYVHNIQIRDREGERVGQVGTSGTTRQMTETRSSVLARNLERSWNVSEFLIIQDLTR
jgi:hypothetical protein